MPADGSGSKLQAHWYSSLIPGTYKADITYFIQMQQSVHLITVYLKLAFLTRNAEDNFLYTAIAWSLVMT